MGDIVEVPSQKTLEFVEARQLSRISPNYGFIWQQLHNNIDVKSFTSTNIRATLTSDLCLWDQMSSLQVATNFCYPVLWVSTFDSLAVIGIRGLRCAKVSFKEASSSKERERIRDGIWALLVTRTRSKLKTKEADNCSRRDIIKQNYIPLERGVTECYRILIMALPLGLALRLE